MKIRLIVITIGLILTIGSVIGNSSSTEGYDSTTTPTIINSTTAPKTGQPRIVIIGAGASGIAAATKLFEAGFKNVTIIEAEDRIGGRIFTTQFGDYLVDLGAQWIHGEKGNIAYDLAAPLGLVEKIDKPNFGVEFKFYDSLGDQLEEQTQRVLEEFYMKHIDLESENATSDKSIGQYIEKMFDDSFKNDEKIYKEKKKYLHHYETLRRSADSSESWYNASLDLGGYHEYEGDRMINWKNKGYSTILDILMKKLPDPQKELPVIKNTILNTTVLTIDYIGDFPSLIATTKGQLYSYKADHVIVTVSLGVLKERHETLFMPPLNDDKVKTIKNLGFGNVAKIYVTFEQPFWSLADSRSLFFNFLWNEADRELIKNNTEKSWILDMGFGMTVNDRPNLLELWITGPGAKALEKLNDQQIFNHTRENLFRFFSKHLKVTEPLAILKTQWNSNPNFRGTYSYQSVKSSEEKVNPAILEKPLKNLTILFAGEATSKDRFSTVDGAISSGWTAANRLINFYRDKLSFVK